MNISELDSYNLADAVKFNDHLNPILWGSNEQLKPEVREKLLIIADEFREFLGVNDLQLKDITISGSNAAYTYTPHSDIDLHLVVDLPEADRNEVYRELFDAKKYVFNDMHNIKIGGYDVELYVQDANKPHHSQGIYSVVNNDWVDVPKRRRTEIDDVSTQSKYEDLSQRIDTAIASDSYKQMSSLSEKIRAMRQAGLDEHGEFGPENLAFKMLRSQGKIKELYDARNAAKDQELSLKERRKPTRSVFTYGFKHEESVAEDAGETWDGVNPTTCMFLNEEDPEPTDEEILKDFIDFCVKELKINSIPTIKLRRDPQWSVVHKTFGRYINDKHLLEVAWGQRHIMDILRTVAHELTHRHQHERDGERMGPDAGETGSKWENEANARAGILMRDYARLHPEYFAAGQAEELHIDEETLKEFDPSGYQERYKIYMGDYDLEETFADIEDAVQAIYEYMRDDPKSRFEDYNVRDLSGEVVWRAPEQEWEKPGKIQFRPDLGDNVAESASGYIPTKRQAKDPRFSMALTKDIRPGALGLNANKLRLNTDKQGQPQLARADGIVQRMKEQLEAFKQGIILESEELDEVRMSPTALKKFAASPAAKGILVGFEAELIFPDVRIEDEEDPEYEPDYDQDTRPSSIQEVIEFFSNNDEGYGLSRRQQERLQDGLDEVYMEWHDEQMMRDFEEEAEDLIKKVMIDEKDWIQEDEIRKQLDMLDVTGEDQEAVLAAGSRAPIFKTSTEQQAYIAEHPEYEKYFEALGEAEDLLDELVLDSVRAQDKYWDAAIDDFRDSYYVSDDSGFFDDVGLRWMSDVSNRFDLGWPYMTSSNDGEGNMDIEDVATSLEDVVQMPVTASGGYHQATREPGRWIVEPDSSLMAGRDEDGGLEIISPPMPIEQAMQKLQAVIDWAQKRGCYTNSSTGLHMGVSLPGQQSFAEAENDAEPAPATEKPIDFVKLALFLGDQHVLKQFEREANHYCESSLKKLKAKNWSPQQIATAMEKMRGNLINLAYKDLANRSPGRDSINMKDNYVEFRSAGGDYLSKESDQGIDFLFNTMLRYVRALDIAGDPAAERQEYAKKLYKLISPEGDNTLDLFSKFATGEITSEQLKKDWAKKTLEKDKPKQGEEREWEAYNPDTGEVLGTVKDFSITNATNYFRDEMKLTRFQVREKEPELTTSRAKLAKKIIQPKAQPAGQQARAPNGVPMWELFDIDTGSVLHAIADHTGLEAYDQGMAWLRSIGAENPETYGERFAIRPKMEKVAGQAIDYNYEIVNLGDVNLGVVDKFYATDKQDADATFDKWLKMKDLPNDTSNYGYRPRKQDPTLSAQDAADPQRNTERGEWEFYRTETGNVIDRVNDADRMQANAVRADIVRRYGHPDDSVGMRRVEQDSFERNSDRIDAIRGRTPDATEQEGTWQLVDVTVNQPVETFQGTWADADRIARQYETGPGERNGHEISVRRAPA